MYLLNFLFIFICANSVILFFVCRDFIGHGISNTKRGSCGLIMVMFDANDKCAWC